MSLYEELVRVAVRESIEKESSLSGDSYPRRAIECIATRVSKRLAATRTDHPQRDIDSAIKSLRDRADEDFKLLAEANDTIEKLREDRDVLQSVVVDLNKQLDECMLRGAAMQARIAELERAEAERPWEPAIGARVVRADPRWAEHVLEVGVIENIVIQYGTPRTLLWVVRWPDGTKTAYATDELRPAPETKP